MLLFLLKMSAFWFVSWLLYRFFLSKETFHQGNRFYLLAAIALGLILPLVEVASPIATLPTFLLPELVIIGTSTEPQIVIKATQKSIDWSWQTYMGILYSIGVLWFSWRFTRELYHLYQLQQNSVLQKHTSYTWVSNASINNPFSFFGLLFWKEDPATHPYILNHELAHIQQWHSFDKLILQLLGIVFWWHPMIYIFQKESCQIHEYLADRAAIAKGNKQQYGQLLLAHASTNQIPNSLTNTFINSPIKNRILMLLQPVSPRKNSWKYLLALPLLTIVFFACQTEDLEAQIKQISAQAAPAEQVDTIITFDPDTFEETIRIVKGTQGKEKNFTLKKSIKEIATNVVDQQIIGDGYLTDTIITFDPDTYNETVTLIRTPFYKEVDQMPTFGDCPNLSGEELINCSQNALLSYIYSNVKYPEQSFKNKVEGTVLSKFVVRDNGYIEAIKIERSVSPEIDSEVLRVLTKMQDNIKALWKPGIKDGEEVNVQFVLPIKFKLE